MPKLPQKLSTRGWSLKSILEKKRAFREIIRVRFDDPNLEAVLARQEACGIPLVIEGWNEHSQWLGQNFFGPDNYALLTGCSDIHVRNIHTLEDAIVPLADFFSHCRSLPTYIEENEENLRWYGKDAECPQSWRDWLNDVLPSSVTPDKSANYLNALLPELPVETLMCYHGVGDTFTPAHKDLCSSSGHNLMTHSENGGSAYWFMTASADIVPVTRYFNEEMKTELDHEARLLTLDDFAAAPFTVYVTQQRLGDLVLVPPRSCHQVVNTGGLSTKTSWSRMTLRNVQAALYHELPLYQRVCRLETYRVKHIIYRSLQQSTAAIENSDHPTQATLDDLAVLIRLFDHILDEEHPPNRKEISLVKNETPVDSLVCSFCGHDLFQSWFQCQQVDNGGDGDDVKCEDQDSNEELFAEHVPDSKVYLCARCVAEGRQCKCGNMTAYQNRPFDRLLELRESAVDAIGGKDTKPKITDTPEYTFSAFAAACLLVARKETARELKCRDANCRTVFDGWCALTCAECHASICYQHQLEKWSFHSIPSILIYCGTNKTKKEAGQAFHACHAKARNLYPTVLEDFYTDMAQGTSCDPIFQATFFARNYRICRPWKGDLLVLGWYDE